MIVFERTRHKWKDGEIVGVGETVYAAGQSSVTPGGTLVYKTTLTMGDIHDVEGAPDYVVGRVLDSMNKNIGTGGNKWKAVSYTSNGDGESIAA